MTSERIEALKKRRQEELKKSKKTNQKIYGGILLIIILFIGIMLFFSQSPYLLVFPIGIMLGFTLERSRFCFASSIRNPLTIGTTKLLQAVIVALMVSTIGFFILQMLSVDLNDIQIGEIPGSVRPLGWNTVLGGILFGTGMVIAGGCASGTLMRIGEGFMLQGIVLVAFIGGTIVAGVFHFPFWYNTFIEGRDAVYLPEVFGFFPALLLQLLILGTLFIAARKFAKKKPK